MLKKSILLVLFSLFLFPSISYAKDLAFAWTANTETNLAGYKIYVGEESKNYSKCVIENIDKSSVSYKFTEEDFSNCNFEENKTYYFAATAFDTDGFESDFSDEVTWTTPNIVDKIINFQIAVIKNNEDGSIDIFDMDGNLLYHFDN